MLSEEIIKAIRKHESTKEAPCCGQHVCECDSYELVPKISYSTWGEYYMYGVYDRYYDYEKQQVWRGNRGEDLGKARTLIGDDEHGHDDRKN